MVASTPPSYRSNRPLYYTDKAADSANIGSIITTFKAIDDVYDNSYVPFTPYVKQSGDANTDVNPEYQFPGYIYCDGTEYNIADFPALYQAIGNEYGGEPKQAVTIVNGGSGYSAGATITFEAPPGYDATNPGALQIIEANLTVVNGVITAIVVTKLGAGYNPVNPPAYTISGSGSSKYYLIGLESWTSTHYAPILFTQALDDTAGNGNQATWLQNYRNAIDAISSNATTSVTTVPTGGHAAFTTNATLQTAIRNAVNSNAGSGTITNEQYTIVPTDGQTHTVDGTSYPVMGKLYVPTGLGASSIDVVVVFHGTVSSGTIQEASETALAQFLNTSGLNIRDKIIFSVAYPQDHISQADQYNLTGVGTQQADFLMGDNLPYARAAVGWVKNSLNAYIAAQGESKIIGDVYLFGHSQGGKLVTKMNTLETGIAGVVANAPGPIQFDQTCSADPSNYSCTKVSAIYGTPDPNGLELSFNFSSSGALQAISPANIFDYWGDPNLGTFKVPDLKTRKIVGYGNVYGPGTPTTGLLTLGVGNDYKGGSWLLTKAAQGGYFSLGTITTTGYEKVVDTASTSIIGSQTVLIEMNEKRLQSVPQHTHFVYHSSASQDLAHPAGYSGDRYLVQYNNGQKSLYSFFPVGGLAFEHKHALLKQPLSDNTVATYDLFDYVPGASGTGSTKWGYENDQYYMASGSQGAGTYELVTYVPVTVFKKFNNSSKIGGRTEFAGATPIIEYSSQNSYTVAGNYTLAMPAAWETMQILAAGGGGGGCSGDNVGGDGGDSVVQVGDGSGLTITAPGGGGASLINGGVVLNAIIEGTDAGNFGTVVDKGAVGGSGSSAGPFYIGEYPDNPGTGGAGGSVLAGNDGGDGINAYVNIPLYTIDDTLTNNNGSIDIDSQYLITNITITLAGAQGVSKGNANGGNGTNGGSGGKGSKLVLSVKNPSSGFVANYTNGQQGSGKSGGGGFGTGGSGGNKNGSGQNGGGGGGCTAINIGGETIAGAGGGGGGGGYDGGNSDAGFAGGSNNTPGWNSNSPLSTTSNLFSGGGANGGNAGCNGGGGGGGGAGCASSSYTGTGGGKGGGGGGPAGHGGGKGGGRGMTSYKSNIFDLVSQNSNNSGDGYTAYSFTIDQSYWTQGGGGGASGNYMYGTIDSDDMTTNSGNISITVGAGGNGGGGGESGNSGQVQVNFGEIVGYEGGVSSVTVGDIVIAGDEDVEIYGNGSGTGSSGGFKLPTTQVPEVEILGGGGGTGAAGTVTVTNGVVNSISLTSGGSNYTAVPEVRIKHGAGTNAYATAEVDQVSKTVTALNLSTLITPATYTNYVKFRGDTQERFIVIKEHDCTNVNRFVIKVARGNGQNGGNTPEHGGDELKIYWNSDQSLNFSNFLGVIVPLAANDPDYTGVNYDGTGSGSNPTNWYWYEVILPNNAKTGATRFKIAQERNPGASTNDNAGDTDHFGICDFIYEYDEVTELVFVPADGSIPKSADQLSYTVEGKENATYPTGATGLDATFTLNSQNPLLPTAAIDPDFPKPLVESYHLCKYLIKAF